MISALERLKAAAEVPGELPDSVAAFGIRAGASRFGRAFASHPPLEERIQALRRA
jgi:heat shock protein HtpX